MEHIHLFQFGQAGSLREARLTHFADAEKPKAQTEKVETPEARLARLKEQALKGAADAADKEAVQVRIDDADKKFQELKDEHKNELAGIKSKIDKIPSSTDPNLRGEALRDINERIIEISTYIDGSADQLTLEFNDSNRPYNAEVQHETFLKWYIQVQEQADRLDDPDENKKKIEVADALDASAVERIKEDVVLEKRAIETAATNWLPNNINPYKTDVQNSVANLQGKLDAVRALSPAPRNLAAQERAIHEGMDILVKQGKQSFEKAFKELGMDVPVEAALDKPFTDDLKAERTKFDSAIKDSKFAEAKAVRSGIEVKLKGIDPTDAQYFAKREALGKELIDLNKAMEKAGAERVETRVDQSARELKEISEANTKLIEKLKKQKDDASKAPTSTERVKLLKEFRTELAKNEKGIVDQIEGLQGQVEGGTAPFNVQEQISAHVKSLQELENTFHSNDVGANKPAEGGKVDDKTDKKADDKKVPEGGKVEKKEEVKPLPESLKKPVADLKEALKKDPNAKDPSKWSADTKKVKDSIDAAFKALPADQKADAVKSIGKEFPEYAVVPSGDKIEFGVKPAEGLEVDRSKFTKEQLDILDKMAEGTMKEILKVLFSVLNVLKGMQVDALKSGKVEGKLGEEAKAKKDAEAKIDAARKQVTEGGRVGGLTAPQETNLRQQLRQQEMRIDRLEKQKDAVSSTKADLERRFGREVEVDVRDGQMFIRSRNGMSAEQLQSFIQRSSGGDRRLMQISERMTFRGDTVGFSERDTANIVLNNPTFNINVINANNSTVAANQGVPGRAFARGRATEQPAPAPTVQPTEGQPVNKPAEQPKPAPAKPAEGGRVDTPKPAERAPNRFGTTGTGSTSPEERKL